MAVKVVIIFHIRALNNKLNNKDYGYYNRNSYTGAGMAIVTE